MNLKRIIIGATLAVALLGTALGAAATSQAGPKPGLTPGKWQGTGVISGSVTDEVGTTTFTGKLGFRIAVDKKFNVEGSGSWVKTMKGSGLVSSTMTGIGTMTIDGAASDIFFLYKEDVEGTVTANGIKSPVKFQRGVEQMLKSRLVIRKARSCTASGIIPAGGGLTMTWTAKRVGRCAA